MDDERPLAPQPEEDLEDALVFGPELENVLGLGLAVGAQGALDLRLLDAELPQFFTPSIVVAVIVGAALLAFPRPVLRGFYTFFLAASWPVEACI